MVTVIDSLGAAVRAGSRQRVGGSPGGDVVVWLNPFFPPSLPTKRQGWMLVGSEGLWVGIEEHHGGGSSFGLHLHPSLQSWYPAPIKQLWFLWQP